MLATHGVWILQGPILPAANVSKSGIPSFSLMTEWKRAQQARKMCMAVHRRFFSTVPAILCSRLHYMRRWKQHSMHDHPYLLLTRCLAISPTHNSYVTQSRRSARSRKILQQICPAPLKHGVAACIAFSAPRKRKNKTHQRN